MCLVDLFCFQVLEFVLVTFLDPVTKYLTDFIKSGGVYFNSQYGLGDIDTGKAQARPGLWLWKYTTAASYAAPTKKLRARFLEAKQAYKCSQPLLQPEVCEPGLVFKRFSNLPKQHHQPGTTCSNTGACEGHFTLRP